MIYRLTVRITGELQGVSLLEDDALVVSRFPSDAVDNFWVKMDFVEDKTLRGKTVNANQDQS